MARTAKPGLRALMAAARIDRTRVAAGDLGFRLGPRINAAGRLGHPGVALDLLLTDDDDRARELAAKLESLNRRRQSVEEEILELDAAQVEARDAVWRERRAYVLASPDWHEGVIGIVASRLVERYGRPVVLIAIGDEGAKGSGRSIPAYDLHAGLSACAGELEKFGGHRAAAGLSIDPLRIERFAELLAEHAAAALDGQDMGRAVHVDAVVAPSELSLELADELARLEPCGLGNPGVTLLAPGDRVGMSFDSCGHCPTCRTGHPSYCHDFWAFNFAAARPDGTSALSRDGELIHAHFFGQSCFATHCVAGERNVVKLPDSISFEVAAPFGCGIQTGALLGFFTCSGACGALVGM
jgi:hypothetical protein